MACRLSFKLKSHTVQQMMASIVESVSPYGKQTAPTVPVYTSIAKRTGAEFICHCVHADGAKATDCYVILAKDATRDLSIIVGIDEERCEVQLIEQYIRTLVSSVHMFYCIDHAKTIHAITYAVRVADSAAILLEANEPSKMVQTADEVKAMQALPVLAVFDAWITPQTLVGVKSIDPGPIKCYAQPSNVIARLAAKPLTSPYCIAASIMHFRPA